MQPPFGAHSRFGAQQPRPGPHQWCPRIAQDCAYASPANDSTNATASVAKIAREIMMSPGSPVGKSCHGEGGRAIEGIGCAEHARHYRKWHATHWPGCTSRNAGDSTRQRSTAYGQRVWKWQPEGGLIGLGTSPCSTRFSRLIFGSGTGTASSSDSV